ncbi:MAG TPA: hypothetical protein DCM07_27340 [Planctomycetaceae bacterium]|nr:hypothetical protein [Gimesia sp.]HAH48490.1 hypothetical protein [Planctomycetaceae bacterium]HBL41896.1 hypothetical protein [Planctomycetaceae bacterium]
MGIQYAGHFSDLMTAPEQLIWRDHHLPFICGHYEFPINFKSVLDRGVRRLVKMVLFRTGIGSRFNSYL